MITSSAALTRGWIGALIYLVVLSLIGAFAIPGGQNIVIRWSWGDWTPVDHASKLWGLSLVPIMGALVAGLLTTGRRAAGLEFVPAPFSWAEMLAIAVVVAAHTIIVIVAI